VIFKFCIQEGLQIRVARIFNTFGPRMHMDDGRVVSSLILQALRNEPMTVMCAIWISKCYGYLHFVAFC